MHAHVHTAPPRRRRRAVAAALGATLAAGALAPVTTGAVLAPPSAAAATTSGPEEPSGTPVLRPTTGTYLDGTTTVEALPVMAGDRVAELAVDGEPLAATPTPATARLLFDVGSNSIEARYGSYVLVNGERVDLDRDMVSERVALDVPADWLVQGANDVRFVVGTFPTSCGDNYDDYDVTEVSLELLGEVADGSANSFSYAFGDGSCGTNTARVQSADLEFDLTQDPSATTGLTAELDTTTLENGAHTLTATTAAGLAATSAVTVNNSAPGRPRSPRPTVRSSTGRRRSSRRPPRAATRRRGSPSTAPRSPRPRRSAPGRRRSSSPWARTPSRRATSTTCSSTASGSTSSTATT
ncbi:hypothetical protein [Cellulosimicrobium sp. CUA-896]|uniref:hypothetical protein n=1 Tax=Cellulosimicrobium sp. CUA-896 TaxID=1517881 RepID=UPI000959DA8E|nr:hypothetical protein [Cellulosimicrobium sp. CUA-896]OLT54323.1 hypothetical protein BJF88_09200 [Cellulosimicrobium sp. CUA-896]